MVKFIYSMQDRTGRAPHPPADNGLTFREMYERTDWEDNELAEILALQPGEEVTIGVCNVPGVGIWIKRVA